MSDINEIKGTLSGLLKDKKVTMCITGGIAIYRTPDIARGLIRHGADVTIIMSEKAAELLNPRIMRWAIGGDVYVEIGDYVEHMRICRDADAVIIVPATANTIGKIANGVADTPVTLCAATALGEKRPLIIVPTMHESLWKNPVTQANIERLKKLGVIIVEPLIEEHKAKIPPNEEVVESVIDAVAPKDLEGLSVLVTAGPTHEHIDAIKYVTTPSSGLAGYYFAREAHARGAFVTLVKGPCKLPRIPSGIEVIEVTSVVEMYDVVMRLVGKRRYDIAVLAAAPVDYYIANPHKGKLQSETVESLMVELRRAPKIALDLKKASPNTFLIAFKAEVDVTEDELVSRALKRLEEGEWDLVLAHRVGFGRGFETPYDEVILMDKKGIIRRIGPAHKREIARAVFDLYKKASRFRIKAP